MSSYFKLLQSRSMKMLSMHLPSMLVLMPWALSTPVNGELAALVGVEDLRPAEPTQRLFQGIDAEVGVQRIRKPRGQYRPRVPVHDRHQVDEALGQRNVGN